MRRDGGGAVSGGDQESSATFAGYQIFSAKSRPAFFENTTGQRFTPSRSPSGAGAPGIPDLNFLSMPDTGRATDAS
jgi:hypothetical protein